jgi:Tol biopolymer transport system component
VNAYDDFDVERICHAALEREPAERHAFLMQACAGDSGLRREVEALLAHATAADAFMESPAVAVAARAVAGSAGIAAGTRIGSYEVRSLLGAGGMGEVYRARDLQLGRDVAIKLLPPVFLSDPARLARFEREARVLAALNHSNIAAIYAVESIGVSRALVLELVEGPTLADRLKRGPLRLEEALTIARQIAEGVGAAHELGIVHRDLKPANIKAPPSGLVKVLDFGLAKPGVGGTGDEDTDALSKSPTLTVGGTQEGVLLGTAAYMSPEQARGQAVDKRADIWAFGCVLLEMLTARAAFTGATVTDILAAVIEREPDWHTLPPSIPPAIRQLLRRCLEKDPQRRLRDLGDARLEIDDLLTESSLPVAGTRDALWSRGRWWISIGTAVFAVVTAVFVGMTMYLRVGMEPLATMRLSVSTPGQITPQLSAVISPDGHQLAFVSTDPFGKTMLWVRELDTLQARALAGTERATFPFWSPDGGWLGFSADGKLKRVPVAGGPVQTLADNAPRAAGTWSQDGVILFTQRGGGIARVAAEGGPTSTIVAPDPSRWWGLEWPQFLPDGRRFLFFGAAREPRYKGVYVGALDSKETRLLLNSDFRALYAPPGYLLFMRDQALMAQPLDTKRIALIGTPTMLADGVWDAIGPGQVAASASRNGVLAYVNASVDNKQWARVDRAGRFLGRVGPPDQYYGRPQISPDGTQIAVGRGRFGFEDVWLLDLVDGTPLRFTFDRASDRSPTWSADARRIWFNSRRAADQRARLYEKDASGGGSDRLLFEIGDDLLIQDSTSDGRFIVYDVPPWGEGKSHAGLWVLPLFGVRKPFPFLLSELAIGQAQVSQDGRWIAYTSNELGRDEIFVQSFPTAGSKRQVSVDGGVQPRWRKDGTELYFVAADQHLMAVPIKGQTSLVVGHPDVLFRSEILFQGAMAGSGDITYDVMTNGRQFLVPTKPEGADPPITVVLNWVGSLKK